MHSPDHHWFQRIVGENCQVSDPLHNYEFNLNWLRKLGTSDYEVSDGDYKYLLNVCGVLNSGTGACEGGGACQTKPDDPNFAPIKTGGFACSKSALFCVMRYDIDLLVHEPIG